MSQLTPVGREDTLHHSIPSRGKASMSEMSKAREDDYFPLPDLSLGTDLACLSKEGTHTHTKAPFKNNLETLGPRQRVSGVV